MESWRKVWREGFAPQLSMAALCALHKALQSDDSRLLQEATTLPPPMECVRDWPVEAACVIGFCGWQGEGLETVAEVEEFFATLCHQCDLIINEPAGCRWFLNPYDGWERGEMRRNLLPEVVREMALRTNGAAALVEAP